MGSMRFRCLWTVFLFVSLFQSRAYGSGDSEQLQKLLDLEAKNIEFLKKYSDKPSIQIKIKSNLVIIRLKIKAITGSPQDSGEQEEK